MAGLRGLAAACTGQVAAADEEHDLAVAAFERALSAFAEADRTLNWALPRCGPARPDAWLRAGPVASG